MARLQEARARRFEAIGERAAHLHGFLAGYALVAKLPSPQVAEVAWTKLVTALRAPAEFRLAREIAEAHGGRIALANRQGGGLRVTISLPASAGRPAR